MLINILNLKHCFTETEDQYGAMTPKTAQVSRALLELRRKFTFTLNLLSAKQAQRLAQSICQQTLCTVL